MKVGDPCEPLHGWIILAIRGKCKIHGCGRYDVRSTRQKHKNVCPRCWLDKRMLYNRRARALARERVREAPYRSDYPMSGYTAVNKEGPLWKPEYDRNIDAFWAARGMTDEDARRKFGSGWKPRREDLHEATA